MQVDNMLTDIELVKQNFVPVIGAAVGVIVCRSAVREFAVVARSYYRDVLSG